ncbi:MAG TPA: dihydrolipoamide acetyltransferase family protein [Steroidobacteraceae bacterium]|nr:dihydrolipoamide acetyltransferase family protein [Steroidobacteraceae bacterium]
MSTFYLPDLGEGLAEAQILQWHVKPGDQAQADQPMVSVETAKAVVEVPVPFSGTVVALRARVGDVIATGAALIDFDSGSVVGRIPAAPAEPGGAMVGGAMVGGATVGGATVGGAVAPRGARRGAVPAARALARHLHIELGEIAGSGPGGVVTIDDVLAQISPADRESRGHAVPLRAATLAAPPAAAREPLRGTRRAMAQSMSLAHAQVPTSTVFEDADIDSWRERGDYMLRLARALIAAWRTEPALNAWYDAAGDARIVLRHVDLAIAVDTADGLIVPVLRAVQDKTPEELRAALAAQKDAAHRRSLAPGELRGGTLMLSNFGSLGGRYAVPLVVPPAVAILGAGKVRQEAVAVGKTVSARRRMPLSLSFDHRCVTGGEACRFLAAVIADLEKPD